MWCIYMFDIAEQNQSEIDYSSVAWPLICILLHLKWNEWCGKIEMKGTLTVYLQVTTSVVPLGLALMGVS